MNRKDQAEYRKNKEIILRTQPLCWNHAECQSPSTEVDHIIPRSIGGSNRLSNLRGSCLPCNRRRENPRMRTYYDPSIVTR